MAFSTFDPPDWLTRLIQGLLGILGFYAAVRFLPRVLKSMTRRFLFGLIGEILLVSLGLFLTRRATDRPCPDGPVPAEDPDRRRQANGSASRNGDPTP